MSHTQLSAVVVRTRRHAKKPASFVGLLARGARRDVVRVVPEKQAPAVPVLPESQEAALDYVQTSGKFSLAATLSSFGE